MALENINEFIETITSITCDKNWDIVSLNSICAQKLPDGIFHDNQTLLQADATTLWSRWFIESFCSPTRYVEDPLKKEAHIFQDALARIDTLFSHSPRRYRESLAQLIAKRIYQEVMLERNAGRTFATKEQKRDLIASSSEARCWICGYRFSEAAVDNFLGKRASNPITLPKLVDIFSPRGIHKTDIRIDVEHIVPVSRGGQSDENLALSCGWCNRYKSSRTSIYDVTSKPYRVRFKLGADTCYELPNPFWTVRILATRRECQHHDGCTKNASNSQLFVAPANNLGSPNPTNLQVVCPDHDPLTFERFVSNDTAKEVWSNKKKKLIFEFPESS